MLIKLPGFAIRSMLCALAITILAAMPPGSASANPYTVADINVDLTRETSAIARQDGLQQAHVQAFEHLLQRLTPTSSPQPAAASITQQLLIMLVVSKSKMRRPPPPDMPQR